MKDVDVYETGDGLTIEVPVSWCTVEGLRNKIRIGLKEAEVLTELLYPHLEREANFRAAELADQERIRRLCADPNLPDHEKWFKCGICGERVRYDNFEHNHKGEGY